MPPCSQSGVNTVSEGGPESMPVMGFELSPSRRRAIGYPGEFPAGVDI